MEIREQAAFTLWALGGQIKSQQRYVAQCFGTSQIVTMLLSNSERLQFIALSAVIALAEEDEKNQNKLYRDNLLGPLLRLLKQYQQLSHRVLLVLVQVFGILCIGRSIDHLPSLFHVVLRYRHITGVECFAAECSGGTRCHRSIDSNHGIDPTYRCQGN